MESTVEYRAHLIAAMYFPSHTGMYATLVEKIVIAQNATLDEAAQEVIAADQTGTQWGEIAAEIIRALKRKE